MPLEQDVRSSKAEARAEIGNRLRRKWSSAERGITAMILVVVALKATGAREVLGQDGVPALGLFAFIAVSDASRTWPDHRDPRRAWRAAAIGALKGAFLALLIYSVIHYL